MEWWIVEVTVSPYQLPWCSFYRDSLGSLKIMLHSSLWLVNWTYWVPTSVLGLFHVIINCWKSHKVALLCYFSFKMLKTHRMGTISWTDSLTCTPVRVSA